MYGGTKSELERLVKDASKLTGQALDPSKFSDVITAIHAVQENMGITGATAEEAAHTIEGSVNSMKAAWSNWLTGLGTEGADMGALTDQLLETIGNVANNVGPVVSRIAQSLVKALPSALAGAFNAIGGAIGDVLGISLPTIDASQITAALQPVLDIVRGLMPIITTLVTSLLPSLAAVIGPIITAVMQLAAAALPPLASVIQAIAPVIQQIVTAVMPPLVSLLQTIIPVISQIASFIGGALVTAIQMLTPIISALTPVVQMVFAVAQNLLNSVIIPILSPLMQLASSLLPMLSSAWLMLQGPLQVISGIFNTVLGIINNVVGAIGGLISKIGQVGSAIANSPLGQFVGGVGSAIGGFLGFAKGGFTTGPYIAGEDPRYPNEAVISFNPAYRAQNLRYWAMAGHMLGASPQVQAASASGGGATYDFSGMTFAPQVTVRGNANEEDIVAAIKRCEGDFIDFVLDAISQRKEASYA